MAIIWSPRARRNLDDIFGPILAENPAAALRTLDAIENRVPQLDAHPDLGRPGRVGDTRELVVTPTPYIVAYRARDGSHAIDILAVFHGARLWPDAFE